MGEVFMYILELLFNKCVKFHENFEINSFENLAIVKLTIFYARDASVCLSSQRLGGRHEDLRVEASLSYTTSLRPT